jgi:hypothetical protein
MQTKQLGAALNNALLDLVDKKLIARRRLHALGGKSGDERASLKVKGYKVNIGGVQA